MLKFESIDYDLNNLFQFEMLKKLLEALAKNQIHMNEKIEGIINTSGQYPIIHSNEIESAAEENEEGLDRDENQGRMSKKLLSIEKKLNSLNMFENQMKAKTDSLNDQLNQTVQKVTDSQNDIINNTNDIKEMKEMLEDMKNKMSDYNMYEMFKDTSEGIGENPDTTKSLIVNLETKIFKKFGLIDERNKKSEEENMKTKTEVLNLKNKTEVMTHQINQSKENLNEKLENLNQDNEMKAKQFKDMHSETNEDISKRLTQLEAFYENINNKFKEVEDNLMKTLNSIQNDDKSQKDGGNISKADHEKNIRYIKDLNKRVSELEKGMITLKSSLNFDEIEDEISKLQVAVKKRLVTTDLDDINEKIKNIENTIQGIKDHDNEHTNCVNSHSVEISTLSKRIENITGVIISMQDGGNGPNYTGGRPVQIDLSKYVDMQAYTNEINNIKKTLSELSNDSNEYRRKIFDLMPLLSTAAKVTDIKTLEKLITSSIEDANQFNLKKFADKIEINKKIKLIDSQLKQTMTDLMKKNEKVDHWLLATKPVANFKCASCENDIQDLTSNKWEYLPWKKYPLKSFADKSYRVYKQHNYIISLM